MLADDHWSLLFAIRRSVRYHHRRQRFLDRIHNLGALFSTVAGSATVATLLADLDTTLVMVAAAATAIFGAFEVVFSPSKSARLHNELAREFMQLEKDALRAQDDPTNERLRELQSGRLEIEAKEPPKLVVLDAMCHDELIRALDSDEEQRTNLKWFQRMMANVVDIGEHRIRNGG